MNKAPISLMESKANQIMKLLGEISEAAWRSDSSLPSLAAVVKSVDAMQSEIQLLRK